MRDRPPDVGWQQVEQLRRNLREALDTEIGVQNTVTISVLTSRFARSSLDDRQLLDFFLELCVERRQLLVGRLQLLLRGD